MDEINANSLHLGLAPGKNKIDESLLEKRDEVFDENEGIYSGQWFGNLRHGYGC